MEFRVLGPLEVVRHGRALELGAGKQRTLLAVLLLHANEVVSTDRLIDELWGERAPATAPKIVQGYVSRLRKVLDSRARAAGPIGRPSGVLLTRSPGYVLRLEDGQLDADRFATLLAEARAALAAARRTTRRRSSVRRSGSGAARRSPTSPSTRSPRRRSPGWRSCAWPRSRSGSTPISRSGATHELVAELEALVARHPLRERLRGQLMLALYRCGRQAEALEVYQDARRVLVDELGLEPGRALQELEQAILRQDPIARRPSAPRRLGLASRGRSRLPLEAVGRRRLRRARARAGALSRALDDALAGRGRLVVIGGEPGIGKSRLAEELASRAATDGAEVLWGRCWEAGGAPPYWPWVQALRAYVRERSREQLADGARRGRRRDRRARPRGASAAAGSRMPCRLPPIRSRPAFASSTRSRAS